MRKMDRLARRWREVVIFEQLYVMDRREKSTA